MEYSVGRNSNPSITMAAFEAGEQHRRTQRQLMAAELDAEEHGLGAAIYADALREALKESRDNLYASYDTIQTPHVLAKRQYRIRQGIELPMRRDGSISLLTSESAMQELPDVMCHHVLFHSQLQRDEYEHTLAGASQVVIPHMAHKDSTPKHLRIECIAKRTGKTLQEAGAIRDFLQKLNADEQTASQFFSILRRTEDATPEQKWERHRWRTLWKEVDTLEVLKEDPPALHYFEEESPAHWMTWEEGLKYREQRKEMREAHDEVAETEGGRLDSDVYKYHPLPDNDQADWLERQPQWYKGLVQFVKDANATQLGEIAKLAFQNTWAKYEEQARMQDFEWARNSGLSKNAIRALRFLVHQRTERFPPSDGKLRWQYRVNQQQLDAARQFMVDYLPPFSRGQADLFWSLHRARKIAQVQLQRTVMSSPAKQVSQRITEAATLPQLKFVGFKMMQLQEREIGGPKSWITTAPEWKLLWSDYNARKKSLTPKMNKPSDQVEADGRGEA